MPRLRLSIVLCRLSGTVGGVALQNPLEEVSRGCVRRGGTALRTKEVRVKNEIARDRRVISVPHLSIFWTH